MKNLTTILFLSFCFIANHTFAQPRVGITGGMNLSVLTGTVNMETSFKPGIIRQMSDTCWEE